MKNPPIVTAMLDAAKQSTSNLIASIFNVKFAGFNAEKTEALITFEIVGGNGYNPGQFWGALRGRNSDLCVGFGEKSDASIAARVFLDGHATKL